MQISPPPPPPPPRPPLWHTLPPPPALGVMGFLFQIDLVLVEISFE